MAKREPKQAGAEPAGQSDVYTLTDLEQVRVLADPLRMKILESLCQEERTTKQVAEELGEKPTRLYHHVDALERVGLIRLTRTRPNRGTIEKYYRAIARAFRADGRLFEGGGSAELTDTLERTVQTVMINTTEELLELARSPDGAKIGEDGVLSYVELVADQAEIDELQQRLMSIVDELQAKVSGKEPGKGQRRYRLTLAYYPLDRSNTKDRK